MHGKMIDKKSFIEYWQTRNNPKAVFFFLIAYVAGIVVVFLPATERMNTHPLFVVAWFVLFFVYVLGLPFLWGRIFYGKPDPQFLTCPFCKKKLGRIHQLVIATGKCGHCGKQILTDSSIP